MRDVLDAFILFKYLLSFLLINLRIGKTGMDKYLIINLNVLAKQTSSISFLSLNKEYTRKASFQPMRYNGGDIKAEFPDRMLYLLTKNPDLLKSWHLKHGTAELSHLQSLM